jgi:hypothetical protein
MTEHSLGIPANSGQDHTWLVRPAQSVPRITHGIGELQFSAVCDFKGRRTVPIKIRYLLSRWTRPAPALLWRRDNSPTRLLAPAGARSRTHGSNDFRANHRQLGSYTILGYGRIGDNTPEIRVVFSRQMRDSSMTTLRISGGVVHNLPSDLRKALVSKAEALAAWEDITPLARNEWICWTISVKKDETRRQHVERVCSDLKDGMRRPCCWPGCQHR